MTAYTLPSDGTSTSSGIILNNGDTLTVNSGGTAISTTVNSGGSVSVSAGGVADSTTLNSSGIQDVYQSGTASATMVYAGGYLDVGEGTAIDTTVFSNLSGDYGLVIGFTGSAIDTSVVSGGEVENYGTTISTTIHSGGEVLFGGYGGTSAISTTVDSGGFIATSEGGTLSVTSLDGGHSLLFGGAAISTTINDLGYMQVADGVLSDTIVNSGTLNILDGSATDTTVNNGGFFELSGDASSTTVNSGGYEVISAGASVSDTLLESGGGIDVTTLSYTAGGTVTLNSATDVLTVSVGGQTYTQQLSGSYAGEYFHLSNADVLTISTGVYGTGAPASGSGTLITVSDTPCYCRGTRILTGSGERAVEDLRLGDKVVTKSGATRSIRWIGRRSYSGRFAVSNREVLPIVIRQGALADEVPKRDLWVSPLHAMFLDGMLIPAAALVNGISIVRAEAVEQLDYFHLELDTHDVIYAEGAQAESFADDNSRAMFHNAAQYRQLYPQAVDEPARYCAPRVEEGLQLEALRQRLIERAQGLAGRAQKGRLLGYLDAVSRERIEGWAQNEAHPDEPVSLRVLDNGVVIGQVFADRYREDLQQAGIGDGRHGFSLMVPGGLSPLVPHAIQVQRISDGRQLQPARATV